MRDITGAGVIEPNGALVGQMYRKNVRVLVIIAECNNTLGNFKCLM